MRGKCHQGTAAFCGPSGDSMPRLYHPRRNHISRQKLGENNTVREKSGKLELKAQAVGLVSVESLMGPNHF